MDKKGTRKDTPASINMPNKLGHQIQNLSLLAISSEEEFEEEIGTETIEQKYESLQSATNDKTIKNAPLNRRRKPTPAYVRCTRRNQKSLSLDGDVLVEEEEEEEGETKKVTTTNGNEGLKKFSSPRLALRKDTPAARPRLQAKARSLCSQESIAEEGGDEDMHMSEDNMSYRLRKQSILLCSHPSLDDISWKTNEMTASPR